MLTFSHTCIGHSHMKSGKPCQDASYAGTIGDLHLAIVSDGHGGERYTRSDIGAQLAVASARDLLCEVLARSMYIPGTFDFRRSTLTQLPLVLENRNLFSDNCYTLPPDVYMAISFIKSAIIGRWCTAVRKHAEEHPLSAEEEGYATVHDGCFSMKAVERLYGCTLMLALVCEDFWMVMQIGDGRCVVFRSLYDEPMFEPVPLDDKCFLNKTTSLCDSAAESELHYCIGGRSTIPYAILLGTDGIEDSWGTNEKLYNFYIDLLKKGDISTAEQLTQELQSALPVLSRLGSHDDMSIAGIVNTEVLHQQVPTLLAYQIEQRRAQLEQLEQQRSELMQKIQLLQEYFDSIDIERLMRDLQNMQSDLQQRTQEQARVQEKLNQLLSESIRVPSAPARRPSDDHLKEHYQSSTPESPF